MKPSQLIGIRNGRIVDDKLLRGGDVTPEGIDGLAARGVIRVICFKNIKQDSAEEIAIQKRYVESAGMLFTHIPMNSQGKVGYDDGAKVPDILALIARTNGRVFVGCHKGSDRTGVVVACYRIMNGWTADQALKEMKSYGASWMHYGMRGFVKIFAQKFSERPVNK